MGRGEDQTVNQTYYRLVKIPWKYNRGNAGIMGISKTNKATIIAELCFRVCLVCTRVHAADITIT